VRFSIKYAILFVIIIFAFAIIAVLVSLYQVVNIPVAECTKHLGQTSLSSGSDSSLEFPLKERFKKI
jgi:hypothetical protein